MSGKRRETRKNDQVNGVTRDPEPAISARSSFYEILVEGHLDEHWSEWLGGLLIAHDGQGHTLLRGAIPDQTALHGVLVKIRDLWLPLVSLRRIDRLD